MLRAIRLGSYVIIAGLASCAVAQMSPPTLAISADRAEVQSGAIAWITAQFTKTSDQAIDCSTHMGGSGGNYSYSYSVKMGGSPVPKVIRAHPELETSDYRSCELPPPQTSVQHLMVSNAYQMETPGVYEVQISRQTKSGLVNSNTI